MQIIVSSHIDFFNLNDSQLQDINTMHDHLNCVFTYLL